DGLCSTASSSSHRLSSDRCRASLPSLRSEYANNASVTSTFRPLTCSFIRGSFGRRSAGNIPGPPGIPLNPYHPREGPGGHTPGAALAQRRRAGGGRRAGGEDVVDDDDPLPVESARGPEGAADVPAPGDVVEAALRPPDRPGGEQRPGRHAPAVGQPER